MGKNAKSKRRNWNKNKQHRNILNNNVVINLSSHALTMAEISVINKGLGFVPAHFKPKFSTINNDMLRFERKLQLHYYFKSRDDGNELSQHNSTKLLLESNSTWWPKKLNGHITKLCYDIKHSIFSILDKHKVKNNLTLSEIKALKALKGNTKIVIKKADKGGGIAVLDSEAYTAQINTMLADVNTYKLTDIDETFNVKLKADELISKLHNMGFLTLKQVKYLTDFSPMCPIFYVLPKVHKITKPLRPICSQIDAPTSRINELVDKYLYIAEQNIPHLLQDTTAYLLLLEKYKKVPPGTILVTMDVASLYTNIPQVEGADWVCDFYDETLSRWGIHNAILKPVDRETLHELILFILQNCSFEFNDHYYVQLYGTTMGAKFSVKFANIYMHMWLTKFVGLYDGVKPTFIARLIDDCFFLWHDTVDELNKFFT